MHTLWNSATRKSATLTAALLSIAMLTAACSSSSSPSAGTTPSSTSSTTSAADATSNDPAVAADRAAVAAATTPSSVWDGPTTGPKAVKGKTIAFVAGSLQNAGDLGVLQGFKAAAKLLDWKVQTFDGQNTVPGDNAAVSQAINSKPDAIIIAGFPYFLAKTPIAQAAAAKIPVIGWHAQADPGPSPDKLLFTNVTSPNAAIGTLAGEYAVASTNGDAHVAVLTDTSIPQTLAKANAIKAAILKCTTCSVLATDSFPFAQITTESPQLVTALLQRFGSKLTTIFSINDLSFDSSVSSLRSAGTSPSGNPHLISAGDGSPSAFQRIRSGQYQTATVAEPLLMHGWQVADEVNRALAHAAPSGYVTKPHLVTAANVNLYDGKNNLFDPPNGYAAQYKKIWGV
jgi:ribose transport system substrate-binding protein